VVIFYVVYQQFENHVLQVQIMSKTVDINQLFVLVSVLVGVELFGILGALLAIPAAGVMQVIVRDLWDHRTGRPKQEITVGEDQTPVTEVIAEKEATEFDAQELDAEKRDAREAQDEQDAAADEPRATGDGQPIPVPE
jgi:hypothetical protein